MDGFGFELTFVFLFRSRKVMQPKTINGCITLGPIKFRVGSENSRVFDTVEVSLHGIPQQRKCEGAC